MTKTKDIASRNVKPPTIAHVVKRANEELVDQNATRVHVQQVNCVKEMFALMVAELIQTAEMTCHVSKENAKINVLKINVA